MERETITIKTPISGTILILNTYLTGREKRALTNIYLTGDMEFDTEEGKVKKMDYSLIDKAQDLAFKTIIVSIDGKIEGEISIIETILDLREDDMKFVIKEVDKVTNPKEEEEKKTV